MKIYESIGFTPQAQKVIDLSPATTVPTRLLYVVATCLDPRVMMSLSVAALISLQEEVKAIIAGAEQEALRPQPDQPGESSEPAGVPSAIQ